MKVGAISPKRKSPGGEAGALARGEARWSTRRTLVAPFGPLKQGFLMLSHQELLEHLHYDPETGVWTWVKPFTIRRKAGDRADVINRKGAYRDLRNVKGARYYSHRLAYFYMIGDWPTCGIDHINRNGMDNRWVNLRHATKRENAGNQKIRVDNTSGFKGVRRHRNRFYARIKVFGRYIYLGSVKTAAEAHELYKTGAKKYFGEFARHA